MIDAETKLNLLTLDAIDTIEATMLRHRPTEGDDPICEWCPEQPWPCPDWRGAKTLMDQITLNHPDYKTEGEG